MASVEAPETAKAAVLIPSNTIPSTPQVKGYDFNQGNNLEDLLSTFKVCGFQATNFGLAVDEINRMLAWRLSDQPYDAESEPDELEDVEVRKNVRCTIFLGYTSNLVSSGVRESIRFLVQNKMVSAVVTTAGGIEEDIIKCLAPTYMGDFNLKGAELRSQGLNRIGNLLVPNANYCKFEDWVMPVLDAMLEEQNRGEVVWSPSQVIHRLGKEINNEESIYYWAWKNNIPVFCPALTDGSLGDMIFFHSYRHESQLVIDLVQDIRKINMMAINAKKSGIIILGGGVVKHHICNANLFRNGADFAVLVNTGQEYDGSDSGARPDEAVSWGKIKPGAAPVKVYAEASIVFPLLVSQTFAAQYHHEKKQQQQQSQQ
eukprot:TRINITY_DN1952_c0_g2_i1.p1 TRINITY_DN1952_c0_g2~~TRINITY_DN1952_c0_g2_i1.p1  ORF type:complete len:372 (-),score=94.49 TRINITY_DN1952_c0_g2_i1:218-1333(-)